MRLDYLVGGFRISVSPQSTTPGPRTHILGMIAALQREGVDVVLRVASDFPGMSRFARVRESDYVGASTAKVVVADIVRIVAAIWCGLNVLVRSFGRSNDVEVLYERLSVFQSLSSFHVAKRRAVRVVEANGILTRETAVDRKVLVLSGLAGWLERRVLRRADVVVAVSEALATELSKYADVPRERILVIPNGADPGLAEVSLPPVRAASPRIGFVGAVVPWQRLDKLLAAVALLGEREGGGGRGASVQIIGDGPALQPLKLLAAELGIDDQVDFVGGVPHGRAMELLREWSIGYAGHEKSSSAVMYHSPLKLYEYAALGLHIMCSPSADAAQLAADGASIAAFPSSDDGVEPVLTALTAAIRAAASDTGAARTRRRVAVFDHHTWDARARLLLNTVVEARARHRDSQ